MLPRHAAAECIMTAGLFQNESESMLYRDAFLRTPRAVFEYGAGWIVHCPICSEQMSRPVSRTGSGFCNGSQRVCSRGEIQIQMKASEK